MLSLSPTAALDPSFCLKKKERNHRFGQVPLAPVAFKVRLTLTNGNPDKAHTRFVSVFRFLLVSFAAAASHGGSYGWIFA